METIWRMINLSDAHKLGDNMKYTPHTDAEIKQMLSKIGVDSLDELFHSIPDNLRYKKKLNLDEGKSEFVTGWIVLSEWYSHDCWNTV